MREHQDNFIAVTARRSTIKQRRFCQPREWWIALFFRLMVWNKPVVDEIMPSHCLSWPNYPFKLPCGKVSFRTSLCRPPPFRRCTTTPPESIIFSFRVNKADQVLSIWVGQSVHQIMQPIAILVLHQHWAPHLLCFPLLLCWHTYCQCTLWGKSIFIWWSNYACITPKFRPHTKHK